MLSCTLLKTDLHIPIWHHWAGRSPAATDAMPGWALQYVLWSLLKHLHDSPKQEHAAISHQLREGDDEEGRKAAPSNSSAHSLSKPRASGSVGKQCSPPCHRKTSRTLELHGESLKKREDDTKQSLPIAVCYLGKRTERNLFYYPMT